MTSQNKSEYIKKVLKEIYFAFDRKKIKKELMDHMEDLEIDFLKSENDVERREKLICEEMGDPTEIGKELNKLHNPWLGYIWYFSRLLLIVLIIYTLLDIARFYNQFSVTVKPISDKDLDVEQLVGTSIYNDYDYSKEFKMGDYTVILERIVITGEQTKYVHVLFQDISPRTFLKQYLMNHQFNAYSELILNNGEIIKPIFEQPSLFGRFNVINFMVQTDKIDNFTYHYQESTQDIMFIFNQGEIK